MATLENKYQRGQIYTIRSHQTDQFYIGSTTQPLHKRLHEHRSHYKLFLKGDKTKTCSSYKIIKNEDNYIELLEDFKCNSKKELNKREGQQIRFYREKCVNIQIAGQTQQEWYQDNKEAILEQSRQHYKVNKEAINQKHRQHYKVNKEAINQKNRQYHQDNKEAINQKQREKQRERRELKKNTE